MTRAGLLAVALVLALAGTGAAESTAAMTAPAIEADPGPVPAGDIGAVLPAASPASEAGGTREAGRPVPAPAPTLGAAGLRVAGATAVVAVLLAITLFMLRGLHRWRPGAARSAQGGRGWRAWCSRWIAASPAPEDRLDVLARSHVGAKESVCIIRAGTERFLVGVTAHQIALLGRLDPVRETAEAAIDPAAPALDEEPAALDFAQALAGATASRPAADEASLRALLGRSRERLSRLGAQPTHSGAGRA
jgi:hypothetical protein